MSTEPNHEEMDYTFIRGLCTLEFKLGGGLLSNPTYLPQDVFHQLVSGDRVQATIKQYFRSSSTEEIHDLVEYARQNPHVFLTLVSCGRVKKLKSLKEAQVRDYHLPLDEEISDSNLSQVVSLNRVKLPPSGFVEGWDLRHLHNFIEDQWMFYAVVFHKSCLLYPSLHPKCPLPFVKISALAESTGSGNFGKVFRVGLSETHVTSAHTEFQYLRRVITKFCTQPQYQH